MHDVQPPRTDDAGIEGELANKAVAPRVSLADVERNIAGAYYFTADDGLAGSHFKRRGHLEGMGDAHEELGLLTLCVLVLRNGFTVLGKSACASPENFDAEIGRKIARADAVNQIWPLMGYALKERLANSNDG